MNLNRINAPMVIFGVFMVLSGCQEFVKKVLPPNPVVVSQNATADNSDFFDYAVKVSASVRNDGGDGEVVFEVTVRQDGKTWTKTQTKRMTAKSTSDFEIRFAEVKLFKDLPNYEIRTYGLGLK